MARCGIVTPRHQACSVPGLRLRHAWTAHLGCDCDGGGGNFVHIELLHSRLSGKKRVFVDGKQLFRTRHRHLRWTYEHPSTQARITLSSDGDGFQLQCEEQEASHTQPESAQRKVLRHSGSSQAEMPGCV